MCWNKHLSLLVSTAGEKWMIKCLYFSVQFKPTDEELGGEDEEGQTEHVHFGAVLSRSDCGNGNQKNG